MRPALSLLFALIAGACAAPTRAGLERFERARPAMGTEFRLVFYARDAASAEAAAEAAFARIAALDAMLTDYAPESELSRFGAASDAGAPSPWLALSADLCAVLAESDSVARASGGAFDVTVGPFTHLWRRARRQGELPDPARLAAAARAVGFEKLELDAAGRRGRLLAPGMRLDLGGIAKGYALDEAFAVLARHGIDTALVLGGGELRAGAPPPGERGWHVRLVGLEGPDEALELAHAALATSGDLAQALELDGVRYSHILDPHTGQALTERRLVSVLGPRALRTDALATALSVLGPEPGLALLARYPRYEARVQVLRNGRIEDLRSPDFPRGLSCADRDVFPSAPPSNPAPQPKP